MSTMEEWARYQGMTLSRYEFRPDHLLTDGNLRPMCMAIYEGGTGTVKKYELRKYWITLLQPPTQYDDDKEDGVDTSELWKTARTAYMNARNLTEELVRDAIKKHNGSYSTTHYNSTHYTTTNQKIYEGVDREKWPRTWKWLVKFSVADDFHRNTRYDWRK